MDNNWDFLDDDASNSSAGSFNSFDFLDEGDEGQSHTNQDDVVDWQDSKVAANNIDLNGDPDDDLVTPSTDSDQNDGSADDGLDFGIVDPNDNVDGDDVDDMVDFNEYAEDPVPVDDTPQPVQKRSVIDDYDELSTIPPEEPVDDTPKPRMEPPNIQVPRMRSRSYAPANTYTEPAQPSYAGTSAADDFVSNIPPTLNIDIIGKIIRITDDYRHMADSDQKLVVNFLEALRARKKATVQVDAGNEATIVKSIIEIDHNIRDGVIELMKSKDKEGAERAFYLMELDAHQLKNVNFILSMIDSGVENFDVRDDLKSIRGAAVQLNEALDTRFQSNKQEYIKPVYDILLSSQRIMKGDVQ